MRSKLTKLTARFLLSLLHVTYWFFPKLKSSIHPDKDQLYQRDRKEQLHPHALQAASVLAETLIYSEVPNYLILYLSHPETASSVVIEIYYTDGLSPADKIAALEELLAKNGIYNPYSLENLQ